MEQKYKPKFMDMDDRYYAPKKKKSIFKTKLQIFLVGFIVFQGYSIMNKKQAEYAAPDNQLVQQNTGFSTPAFASDNGGRPLDIPFNPYAGSATSDMGQMQAAAHAEAQRMMATGDIAAYEAEVMRHPEIAKIMGLQ